jgi:hypothetical protein
LLDTLRRERRCGRIGYRTTEIYAKYDPTYLSAARTAIDAAMADIDGKMKKRKLILPSQPQLVTSAEQ